MNEDMRERALCRLCTRVFVTTQELVVSVNIRSKFKRKRIYDHIVIKVRHRIPKVIIIETIMSLKQSIINNFYKRKGQKQSDSESESDDDPVYLPSKQKRIYEQPMFWTRVKSIEIAASQRVTLFDVE